MSRRRVWLGAVWLAGGCWQEEPLIDDTFTEDEWRYLSVEFRLPEPDTCPTGMARDTCDDLAVLGQRLFFTTKISGPIAVDDPLALGAVGETDKLACVSCHDPSRFFIDTRQPTNVSIGAKVTKHNALSVVNQSYKSAVANTFCNEEPDADPALCHNVFAWTGNYPTPGEIITNLANGAAAMGTTPAIISNGLNREPAAYNAYTVLFGSFPPICDDNDATKCHCDASPCDTPTIVADHVSTALELYVRRLDSVDSDFDKYVAGTRNDDGSPALNEQQRRGLKLFIGKAMCIDCHRGPLLSDLRFHNTGVPQIGSRVPAVDLGLGGVTTIPNIAPDAHLGEFLTPPLRHVAETAPYMHAGQFATLAEVIAFYRSGGVDGGFSGRKDPRIQPLDLTDDEARDLERFLEALTGSTVDETLAKALP